MGEGPSAAEALGEFGEGVKKRQSEELLHAAAMSASASSSGFASGSLSGARSSARASASAAFDHSSGNPTLSGHSHGQGDGMGVNAGRTAVTGRKRGGSLGRDSRLYGEEEEEVQWGIEVEGVRLGECSALTGEGEWGSITRSSRAEDIVLPARVYDIGSITDQQVLKPSSGRSRPCLSNGKTTSSGSEISVDRAVWCSWIRKHQSPARKTFRSLTAVVEGGIPSTG